MDSTILPNPSDPEATFRSKTVEEHRGYVANLKESVDKNSFVPVRTNDFYADFEL